MDMDADVMSWIVELPFALSDHAGMDAEAVEIYNLFAEVHYPDNFFGLYDCNIADPAERFLDDA